MNAMLINYPQQLTLKFLSLINVDLPILTKCNINKLVLFNQSVFTNAKINFNNLPENLETLVIDCLFLNTNENLAKIILNKKFDNIKNIILSSKYYGYEEIIKNSEVKNHFFSYFSNAIIRTEDKEVTEINE